MKISVGNKIEFIYDKRHLVVGRVVKIEEGFFSTKYVTNVITGIGNSRLVYVKEKEILRILDK